MSNVIKLKQNPLDRTTYMGSGDAAAACGVSPFATPLDVYLRKLGEPNDITSRPLRFGSFAEPFVLSEFELETGLKVTDSQRFYQHPAFPYIGCHIDGQVETEAVVEAKTTSLTYDELPDHIHVQVQQQLACTGFELAYVPVLMRGRDFKVFEVEANAKFQDAILLKMAGLWARIQQQDPPPPVTESDVRKLFPDDTGTLMIASPDLEARVKRLSWVKHAIKEATDQQKVLETSIKADMGETATLKSETGEMLATWKSAKPATRFDSKTFQTDHPDLFESYQTESRSSRRFLLKAKKEIA